METDTIYLSKRKEMMCKKKRNVIPLSKIEFQEMKNPHSIVDDLPKSTILGILNDIILDGQS